MTGEQLDNWFTYHAPAEAQLQQYTVVRREARIFAGYINEVVPESADKTAAIRLLRECVMTANAAIACGGK